MGLYEQIEHSAKVLAEKTGQERHDIVVVLGSGLGNYPQQWPEATLVSYQDLPGFVQPKAIGHRGAAYSVRVQNRQVLLLSGRIHFYEGHPIEQVVFAVRMAVKASCEKVVLTNASGGCGEGIERGDLVLITDHLNLAGVSPLRGENDPRLGVRFPDMTHVYSPHLREVAHNTARELGIVLKKGVYCWFQGPMFETPAEVQMAKQLGGDLVGMSTVPEAIAAHHMGAQVLGISLCTNLAAGISDQPITSSEVMETGDQAAETFGRLMTNLLPQL